MDWDPLTQSTFFLPRKSFTHTSPQKFYKNLIVIFIKILFEIIYRRYRFVSIRASTIKNKITIFNIFNDI